MNLPPLPIGDRYELVKRKGRVNTPQDTTKPNPEQIKEIHRPKSKL
jgi:hypothetical protein